VQEWEPSKPVIETLHERIDQSVAARVDRERLIRDLANGHHRHPARIVAFNTAEG
jgi:hypothetical protein